MDICIRADGGNNIGMGHIMRTLVLAKKLKLNHNVFYVCKSNEEQHNQYSSGISFLERKGFLVKKINENNLKENIKKIKADCIITDSYDIDEEYFDIIKKQFKFSGYIDDNNKLNYFNVDFLINQNLYATKLKYNVNENTKLLLGSEFVLLRDEFRNNNIKVVNENIKDIMITLGGSDKNNLTEKIINVFVNYNYNLHVVIGSGFNNLDILKKYENKKIKLYLNANMSELMSLADVCISACGSTIYELASKGVPTIGIVSAENQSKLAKHLNNRGLIIYSEINNIGKAIQNLTYEERIKLTKKVSKIIDGNGVFRISEQINNILR